MIHGIVVGKEDVIPAMEDRLPLEILVEIGIEKLRRDYTHAFMSSYFAGKDELSPFLSSQASVEESLSRLGRLHYALELVVLLQTYLSPGQECLKGVVRQALKEVGVGLERDGTWEFEMAVPTAFVREQLVK